MITRCHHCGAEFDVSTNLVFSRDPSVRCGQCMELFDAKANLYDKNEAAKAAATFKPVNPVKVDKINVAALENAETVAIEHRYVRANKANDITVPNTDYRQPDIDLGVAPEHIPAYAHDGATAAQIEMDQTIAMRRDNEGLTSSSSANNLESGISEHRFDYRQSPAAGLQATATVDDMRMQIIRDRERRALDIEPTRGLDAEQMRIVEEYKQRNETSTVAATPRADVDGAMLGAEGTVSEKTKDLEFIPENALQQNTVHRESGWQDSGAPFQDGTPRFSTEKTETYTAKVATPSIASTDSSPAASVQQSELQTGKQTLQQTPARDDYKRESEHRMYPTSTRSKGTQVSETSAQEMRRYLSHRSTDVGNRPAIHRAPVVGRNQVMDHQPSPGRTHSDASVLSGPQTKVSSSNNQSNSTWLWVLGLIVVGCVGLYVGRDSVAKLELPDTILTPFCQLAGCTPGNPAN